VEVWSCELKAWNNAPRSGKGGFSGLRSKTPLVHSGSCVFWPFLSPSLSCRDVGSVSSGGCSARAVHSRAIGQVLKRGSSPSCVGWSRDGAAVGPCPGVAQGSASSANPGSLARREPSVTLGHKCFPLHSPPSGGRGPTAPRSRARSRSPVSPPAQGLHSCRGTAEGSAHRRQRRAAVASQGRCSPDVWSVLQQRLSSSQLDGSSSPSSNTDPVFAGLAAVPRWSVQQALQ